MSSVFSVVKKTLDTTPGTPIPQNMPLPCLRNLLALPLLSVALCAAPTPAPAATDSPPAAAPAAADVSAPTDAQAQLALGKRYFHGEGVPKNHKQAYALFLKAAQQGLAEAQFLTGYCLLSGYGCAESNRTADIWLEKAAAQGDKNAMLHLAQLHFSGPDRDLDKAIDWFEKAAGEKAPKAEEIPDEPDEEGTLVNTASKRFHKQRFPLLLSLAKSGNEHAQYALGAAYAYGEGVPVDARQSLHWLLQAEAKGNHDALLFLSIKHLFNAGGGQKNFRLVAFLLGKFFEGGGASVGSEIEEAAKDPQANSDRHLDRILLQLKKSAEDGSAGAQSWLGAIYSTDLFGRKDIKSGVHWFEEASKNGEANAKTVLAEYYASGKRVEKNYDKALALLREVKTDFPARASMPLGMMYHLGLGVAKDEDLALSLWRQGAIRGDTSSQLWLSTAYQRGIGVEIDPRRAAGWLRVAAQRGDPVAQEDLGVCYQYGTGVQKNEKKALEWFQKAAEYETEDAIANLIILYQTGTLVPKDEKKAFLMAEKLAKRGSKLGQYTLAEQYELGRGTEVDLTKAAGWMLKSAEQDHAEAQLALGKYYQDGKGLPASPEKALHWYRLALANKEFLPAEKVASLEHAISLLTPSSNPQEPTK